LSEHCDLRRKKIVTQFGRSKHNSTLIIMIKLNRNNLVSIFNFYTRIDCVLKYHFTHLVCVRHHVMIWTTYNINDFKVQCDVSQWKHTSWSWELILKP